MSLSNEEINELVSSQVSNMGYSIYMQNYNSSNSFLQLFIEKQDFKAVTIDDCEKVAKAIRLSLMVEAGETLFIEVSSPGLDRPLLNFEHYSRFIGKNVKVNLKRPIENKKRFIATIIKCENDNVTLYLDEIKQEIDFKIEDFNSTNLIPEIKF